MLPGGEVFDCAPGQSILGAAISANVPISSSCRSGRCGSCLGRLVAGEIEYPDGLPEAISDADAAAGYVLFCSAHAKTDLTIELLAPRF